LEVAAPGKQSGRIERMRHAGFRHEALIYADSEEYLAGTVSFLRAGLEAEAPILVAVGPQQTDLLRQELGPDAERIRFADMWELGRNPAWIIPFWSDFAAENRGRAIWGIGEPVWAARGPAALEECQRHECLLEVAFAAEPAFSLLCPYDAASLSAEVLEEVSSSHRLVAEGEEIRRSSNFDPARDCLAGELPAPPDDALALRFGVSELAQVRRVVAVAAEEAGLGHRLAADLVTAASELAANSVMHGGGGGVLRLWREDGTILVDVEDRGRIEEPLAGRMQPDVRQEGGRGLWLANRLCDLVQIRSGEGGTQVRLHLSAAEPAFV
jgi:anti-sigma regulatory factor (Ser/Thr protein kinase)